LVFAINILAFSIKKQFINPKKIYCVDQGIRRIIGFIFSEDAGRIYENMVFVKLKMYNKKVYYWKNKGECDFVIQNKNKIEQVIQVSYELKENKEREVKGLIEVMEEFNVKKGTIITQDFSSKETNNDKEIEYIPLWKWLLS